MVEERPMCVQSSKYADYLIFDICIRLPAAQGDPYHDDRKEPTFVFALQAVSEGNASDNTSGALQ